MRSALSFWNRGLTVAGGRAWPQYAVSGVAGGLISGFLCAMIGISYGTLAFSGPLSSHLSQGLAAGLIAALVLNLAIAARSSLPWSLAHAQPTAAVVIAVMGASIA